RERRICVRLVASFRGGRARNAIDSRPRRRTVARQGPEVPLAVVAMFFSDGCRSTRDRGLLGVRDLEVLSHHSVLVGDAGSIEKGDLKGWLELDVQEMKKVELVRRCLRVEADDLRRQP